MTIASAKEFGSLFLNKNPVFPSIIVSVEAQAMQIPIIASDIGGSKETIIDGKTGFLFKNKDSNSLAETIVMVMQKDYNSLKSIGFEGRKNVLKRFDVDKMCQTTFTEYKKLIKLP